MYAVIKTGGKQYRVAEGDVLNVEKLNAEAGSEVVFDEVLTVVNDADVKIGQPVVEGAKVTAKVVEQGKGEKILVFKYKAKSNYRKRQGHRQPFTKYEVAGHAGAAEEDGYDLVCNSVSVLTQAPLIGLERYLKLKPQYTVDEESGIFTLKLDRADSNTQAILETMVLALQSVERQFPQYVKVKDTRR